MVKKKKSSKNHNVTKKFDSVVNELAVVNQLIKSKKKKASTKKIKKKIIMPKKKKVVPKKRYTMELDKPKKKTVPKKSRPVSKKLKPVIKKTKPIAKKPKSINNPASLQFRTESEIAMDFATKVYMQFNKIIKSVVLFGSTTKQESVAGSDIDIIIVIDDVSINWDEKLVMWYRTELDKILRLNPYRKSLHINTIKLSTWWDDLIKGDPVVINIIRYGEAMIDFAGFFEPLKFLLVKGKISSTPEAIYNCLERAPMHLARSKGAEIGAIEGLYWAMVDSSHAALIASNILPPSPEYIPRELKETFVDNKKLKMKYVIWYRDLHILHKKIAHKEITDLKGVEIDEWQARTKEFLDVMINLVNDIISDNN